LRTDSSLVEIVIEQILRLESPLQRFHLCDERHGTLRRAAFRRVTSSSSVLDWDPAEFTETDEFGPGRGLRNECRVWHGHPLLFGRAAPARDEAARES